MTAALRHEWLSLLPHVPELGEELIGRWSEPHRRYHDKAHLASALRALAEIGGTGRTERLAIWFHDAVHTGTPGSDEQDSADLAIRRLSEAGLPAAEVEEVARLILVTQEHDPALGDEAGARVSDADLAILGSAPHPYSASVASLREESPGLDDLVWRDQRLVRVTGLLDNTPIFHTRPGRDRWEAQALRNLSAERWALLELT